MSSRFKIKKGDRVMVISGDDKGKTGEVTEVLRGENRVLVEGINMVTKHMRPSRFEPGGKKQMEAPVHISNVAHIDPENTDKPTRIGIRRNKDGVVERIARRSGKTIAAPRRSKGK